MSLECGLVVSIEDSLLGGSVGSNVVIATRVGNADYGVGQTSGLGV